MIAAMVSNFLSLTTALFTMTVYDRVIPNGAFESLIALSIGVIIALAFDFLIKSLRASFIDTASKRADLEISRRLFERILTLTPNQQKQKTNSNEQWRKSKHQRKRNSEQKTINATKTLNNINNEKHIKQQNS